MNSERIGNIAQLSQGIQVPIDKQYTISNENSVRFLRIIDYTQNKDEIRYIDNPGEKYLVDNTDVIMIRYGDAGKVVRGYEGVIANNLFKISIPENLITKEYLYYYLSQKCIYERLVNNQQKTGLPAVNFKTVNEIEIKFPKSIENQNKIVEILDKSNMLIDKRKEQIYLLDELVKSRFIEMFGDPVTNPKGWKYPKIEDVVANEKNAIKAGPFGSALKKEYYVESGYKIYGQEQVISGDVNFGDYYISEEKYKELENCAIKSNDVLISLVGTYGKLLIIPEKFEAGIINPRLMKITFDKTIINTTYFKYFFQSESLRNKLSDNTHGGTMPILNVGIVRNIHIPLPPIELQNQFAYFVKQVDKLKLEMENSLKELEDNFYSLMQKAFKGELFN